MTLEEAIKHCEEKACDNTECAAEHRQLAEWLKELMNLQHLTDDHKTLPKDLEEAIKEAEEFAEGEWDGLRDNDGNALYTEDMIRYTFVEAAKWQKEQMIKDVVKWLKKTGANNLYISMFQRDMEDEK